MRTRRVFAFFAASTFLCACLGFAQDSQSLGDVARQSRLQKQQKDAQAKDTPAQNSALNPAHSKDGQTKDAPATDGIAKDAPPPKASHVITNDEIPEHAGHSVASTHDSQGNEPDAPATAGNHEARAEQWKSQIQSQKSAIANLRQEICQPQRLRPLRGRKLRCQLRRVERAPEGEAGSRRGHESADGRTAKAARRYAGIRSQTRLWKLRLRSVDQNRPLMRN